MFERAKDFLRRIGPSRNKYQLSIMPKDAVGIIKWIMDGRRDIWSFPPPLPCNSVCKRRFRRIHFSCLTCWTRKLFYKKRGWQNLKRYREVWMANHPPVGHRGAVPLQKMNVSTNEWIALPVYYTNYGIFIPTRKDRPWDYYRLFIVKYLLCLAERIAEL